MDPELVGYRVKQMMKNKNITVEELSEKMKINKEELKKKLEGQEEFYIGEMHKVREIFNLNLEEVEALFFEKNIEV